MSPPDVGPRPGARRSRVGVWGVATALLYLASVVGAWPHPSPLHLLYDGFSPPPPYRWVRPTSAESTEPPEPGAGVIALSASGSSSGSIVTDDGQAGAIFSKDAIEGPPGESAAEVHVTPLDPASIAAAPPGLRFDGNAYRVEAVYASSHRPATLRRTVTVVLRYPTSATVLLQFSGSDWTPVEAHSAPIALQIYAETRTLGLFVAAGQPTTRSPLSSWVYRAVTALLWAAIVVILAGLLRDYLRQRDRRRRGGLRR